MALYNFNNDSVKTNVGVNETIFAYFLKLNGGDFTSPGVAHQLFGLEQSVVGKQNRLMVGFEPKRKTAEQEDIRKTVMEEV